MRGEGEVPRFLPVSRRTMLRQSAAGFGSLAWSSNADLASLGPICAAGIGVTFLIAVVLKPKALRARSEWNVARGAAPE